MTPRFVSRFKVCLGSVIRDKRRCTWVVIGIHCEMGGNCQLVKLVRANTFGLLSVTKYLADEKFDEFQFDHIP